MNNKTILIKTVLNSAFVSFEKLWRSQKLLTSSSTSIILHQMILSLIQTQSWLLIIINPLLGAIFMCRNYYNVFCKHINSESIIFLLNLVWLELQCKICVWINLAGLYFGQIRFSCICYLKLLKVKFIRYFFHCIHARTPLTRWNLKIHKNKKSVIILKE